MSIHKVYVVDREGLNKTSGIRIETLYLLEGDINPENFIELFVNPRVQVFGSRSILKENAGPILEIRHKKSMQDPELASLRAAASALFEDKLEYGRIARRYQFPGLSEKEALEKLKSMGLFNSDSQEIADPNEIITALKPISPKKSMKFLDLRFFSDEELQELSRQNSWNAPLAQLQTIRRYSVEKNRPLTFLEVGLFIAAWCNHCYHWVWKALRLFQKLRDADRSVNHPLVISGLGGGGAAIVTFDANTALIFKIESHNHPLFISPEEANKTGVGGAVRDIFSAGKGGWPILCCNAVCTTLKEENPEGCIDPDAIVLGAVNGLANYGNPLGVPVGEAIYKRHAGFAKPYTGVYAVGMIPRTYVQAEKPQLGDIVLLIGGRTGRDGIHGASGSSGAITSRNTNADIATVQLGYPVEERKLGEAICALRDKNCTKIAQDLGAGGLVGAGSEIAAEIGIRINLAKVPLKDASLSEYEIGLSESQERMIVVVPPQKLRLAKKVLKMYDVECAVVGRITGTKKFEAMWHGKKVIDIDMDFLWGECPIEELPVEEPPATITPNLSRLAFASAKQDFVRRWADLHNLRDRAKQHLTQYNIADQSPALFQFDKTVQGRVVIEPLGGKNGRMRTHLSGITPTCSERGLISTLVMNPQWSRLGPETYAERTYIEATARLAAAGADPHQMFLCANFYSPEQNPETNWYLTKLVDRLCELQFKFRIPIVNVKDSSSGTFIHKDGKKEHVPVTLTMPGAGFIPDVKKVITQDLKSLGSTLILVRPVGYLKGFYANLHQIYRKDAHPILSAAVIGEGGLMKTLFEMCYGGDMGMNLDLWKFADTPREQILFEDCLLLETGHPSWHTVSFVFEIAQGGDPKELHKNLGLPEITALGRTHDEKQIFVNNTGTHSMRWNIDELAEAWEKPFRELLV